MDWITIEQVKRAAEQGEMEALKCSLLHHEQGRDADWVELRDAIEDGKFDISYNLCACCISVGGANEEACKRCGLYTPPYNPSGSHCCGESWQKAQGAFIKLRGNYSNANFKAFQEAEAEVCTYIEGVIAKKKAEQEKCRQNCEDCKHYKLSSPCIKCTNSSNFEAKKESKPALRHGDYGYDEYGTECMAVSINAETGLRQCSSEHLWKNANDNTCKPATVLGNIFDDLARNAEDLEKFEFRLQGESGKNRWGNVTSHIHPDGDKIWLWIGTDSAYYDLDQATEIAHKILQEVATAKRKQSNQ